MEKYIPIKGFDGFYEISNFGKVKSIIRNQTKSRNRPTTKKEKILKWSYNPQGYPYITLTVNWKRKIIFIHRLIAENFIPNPNNYNVVNHLDGDKNNCNVFNLEWTTHSLNLKHAYDNGLRKRKINPTQKLEILQLRNQGLTYCKIAEIYNVTHNVIYKICKIEIEITDCVTVTKIL